MVDSDVPPLVTPTLYRPTWADPGFVLSTNVFKITDYALLGSIPTLVAPNNPKRWGIGFCLFSGGPNALQVGPWPDMAVAGMSPPSGQTYLWYNIFTFGPMVAFEWYALLSFGATLRVMEVTV